MWSQRVRHDWATELNWIIYFMALNLFSALWWLGCIHDSISGVWRYLPALANLQVAFLVWFFGFSNTYITSSPSDQIRSVAQLCLTLRDPTTRSTPGLPVHHQLPEFTQTHVHWVGDAIQPSHPLLSPSPPQDWSPLGWTGWISLQSKGLSRVFSNTTVQKHQFFGAQSSSQSSSHIHTWLLEKP